MKHIEVIDLDEHQHYKTRNIHAWIKLDCTMLAGESIYNLCEIDRWRYVVLIMLAVSRSNKVKYNIDWLQDIIKRTKGESNERKIEDTLIALEKEKLIRIVEDTAKPVEQPKPTTISPKILRPMKIGEIIRGGQNV